MNQSGRSAREHTDLNSLCLPMYNGLGNPTPSAPTTSTTGGTPSTHISSCVPPEPASTPSPSFAGPADAPGAESPAALSEALCASLAQGDPTPPT